jgi:hypothetical protein
MARGVSYFGKGGEYIPNIKEYNDKIAKAKAEVEAKKYIRTTQYSCRRTNKWNRSNKLDSDVIGYRGGATACRRLLSRL